MRARRSAQVVSGQARLSLMVSLALLGCPPQATSEDGAVLASGGIASSAMPSTSKPQGSAAPTANPGASSTATATATASSSAAPAVDDAHRTVAAFTEVRVSKSLQADIDIGPSAPLKLTGDPDIVKIVKTEVNGGVLTISLPEGGHSMAKPLIVRVTMPKLTALQAHTSATIKASNVASDDLKLEASTSGSITITGTCKKLAVTATTSGRLDAGELACEDVKVEANTSGEATVNASNSVSGNASTSARVHVKGNPKEKKIVTATSGVVD